MKPFKEDLENIKYLKSLEFQTREEFIDYVLSLAELSESKPIVNSKHHRFDLSIFQNVESLMASRVKEHIDDQAQFLNPEITQLQPSDLGEKLDISFLGNINDDPNYAYGLTRLLQVDPHEVRGQVVRVYPIMARFYIAFVHKNGFFEPIQMLVGWDGNDWHIINTKNFEMKAGRLDPWYNRSLKMGMSIQFTYRYSWRVSIGYGKVSIAFITDPVGIREIFRLRDIPEGKQRRASLRNWVSKHWRKKYDDPSALIEVRKHLRGATEFHWNGMVVRVIPSRFDLEQNLKRSS